MAEKSQPNRAPDSDPRVVVLFVRTRDGQFHVTCRPEDGVFLADMTREAERSGYATACLCDGVDRPTGDQLKAAIRVAMEAAGQRYVQFPVVRDGETVAPQA